MRMRSKLDISAYLVIGPENTCQRPVDDVIRQALDAGFTCVQIRSKECSARDLIEYTRQAADVIAECGKTDTVALLVDDRLDVVLAARDAGIAVGGIHVGQTDIPVEVCRRYLGQDAIVGLSARADEMLEHVKTADMSLVDYLGVGPFHETQTKLDCERNDEGAVITYSVGDLCALAQISPVPIVVGGGVKLVDIPVVKSTGADGFFVVSAVCAAPDPYRAAHELVHAWRTSC